MNALKARVHTLRLVITSLFTRFKEHNISSNGAQIAFFLIFSLFPFLLFINTLLTSLSIPKASILEFLDPLFPNQIVAFVSKYLDQLQSFESMGFLSTGIVLALFTASKSVRTLASAFNRAYDTDNARNFFVQIFFSMFFLFLFSLIIIACIILVAFGNDFVSRSILGADMPLSFVTLVDVWRWSTTSLIFFFAISAMYKFLPSAKIKFSETLPGAFFSLSGFLVLTGAFSFYVNNIAPASIFYGSIGAIILFMLWMYFFGIILLLGAELNNVVADLRKKNKEADNNDDI